MKLIRTASALLVLASLGAATPTTAEETVPATPAEPAAPISEPVRPAQTIEEIVVSARKTEESIQDVPVAVTALSAEKLQQTGTFGTLDLQFQVPNMYAREGVFSSTAAVFQIRGQVQVDNLGTLDPSVGFYDDGIYAARPHGANVSFVDVRSVEVLRGPQGTLFGRNTTGGAILLNSQDPDFDGVSGALDATVATFERRDLTAVLNLPLWQDLLALRVAGKTVKTGGWAFEETNERDIATENNEFVRVKLLFRPLESVEFLLTGTYLDIDQLLTPNQPIFALKPTEANEPVLPGGTPCCLASLAIPNYDSFVDGERYHANYDPGYVPRSSMRMDSLALTGIWDTAWATLKLIGGVRRNHDVANRIEVDATPTLFVDSLQFNDNRQLSGELQLTGSWLGDRFQWAAGGYYFDEDGSDNGSTTAFASGLMLETRGDVENSSQGGYAQGTYRIFDKLGLTGGVRYSTDEKDLVLQAEFAGLCQIPSDLRDDPNPQAPCRGTFERSFSNVSYTVGADYRLLEDVSIFGDVLLYASRTTGYRSGGQNLRGASPETLQPFDQETVLQHEIGMKSDLLDRRMRLNVAGFFTDYNDIQRNAVIAVNGVPATVISNAAKATVNGVEVELTALPPLEGLELGASLGIVKPKYEEFVDASGLDRSSEKFDDVPEMTYSLSGSYVREILDVPWLNRVDWAWQDDVPSTQGSSHYFRRQGVENIDSLITMPSGGILNVRSAVTFANGLELAFFARNLTEKFRFLAVGLGDGPDFITRGVTGSGREFGGQVSYRF